MKTREAQQRMEEMQRLLGHRANSSEGGVRPRIRAGSIFEVPSASPGTSGPSGQLLRSLAAILGEADQCLNRASANQDKLERGIHDVTGQYKEVIAVCLCDVLEFLIGSFAETCGTGTYAPRTSAIKTSDGASQGASCGRHGREGDHVRGTNTSESISPILGCSIGPC